jgi:hypothetical protein
MRIRKTHLRKIHNVPSKRMDYILLGIIMLVAAVLRLWKLGQIPFMHDEFSAMTRLGYDIFRELIRQGVAPDAHPAGVQVFLYYWAKVVGWNAFWVKLPFVLMGIGSIYLIYIIGRQWFNRKVGLLSAAFFAISEFTVFYSQLARPYAAGLFFVLLQVYFWNRVLFDVKKPSPWLWVGFALSSWLAAMMHAFSIAQAGLIFLTGLFFLSKERRKAYWISGLGALLLFSPNLPIFYRQLFFNGGVGGWLSAPKSSFLFDFLQYTMNYDYLFMFVTGVIVVLPFILGHFERRKNAMRFVGLAWFLVIFLLAYIYSLMREPIIQFSTLLFCCPFLIIVAFSFFTTRTLSPIQAVAAVLSLLFVGVASLINTRQYYRNMYHQGYDQIAVEMQEDEGQYGGQVRFATWTGIREAAEYYQEPTGIENRIVFDRDNSLVDFNRWLDEHGETSLLGFGWTDYAGPVWEVTAVGNYPYLIKKKDWFTSRYLTLSKTPTEGAQYLLNELSTDSCCYVEGQEWGQSCSFSCDSLPNDVEALGVIIHFHNEVELNNCVAVIEVHDAKSDSLVLWNSSMADDGRFLPGSHAIADAILFSDDFKPEGKTIKAYLWNQDKKPLVVTKLSYYYTKKSPVLTGLYEPLN